MNERRQSGLRSGIRFVLAVLSWALGASAPPLLAQYTGKPVIELRGVEKLGIGTGASKSAAAKLGQDLLALYQEYQAHLNRTSGQGAAASPFKSKNELAPIAGGAVVIDAAASGDPEVLAADLRALGAEKVAVFGRMVSCRLPITAIPALGDLPSLQFARPAYAIRHQGAVTSQGDLAMHADIARMTFGVDGTGVTVGTLSDSFNCLGDAPDGVASGDLPAGIRVLNELDPCTDGTDEGRAMMEIIHDVAPGASLAFHTAFEGGQAGFAQGIIALATAGAKVINDDVLNLAEPFYQDGIVAQAVNTVKAMSVAYFSSAGNAGRNAYESPFRPSGQLFSIGRGPSEAHDFDPGPGVDVCQQITIPVGRTLTLVYQWDQPFFSVSGPGSASDLDIVLTNAACSALTAGSALANIGGDPVEIFSFTNQTLATIFGIIILRFRGPSPGLMKYVNLGSGIVRIDEFDTKTGASWGHSAALGGLGVGAADYRQTPVFGQTPPLIEDFSSAGSTPILFDTAGNRLAMPELREQPDITAPDGVNTTFFGGSDPEGDGFPNFFGTSAAAPHAAGVAALILDSDLSISPDALYSVLKATAVNMDDPFTAEVLDTGFDCGTGFGLVQAEAALGAAPNPPAPLPSQPLPAGCFVAPLPMPPAPVLCQGRTATIVGTDGDDPLTGTPGDDVIHGLAGNDRIAGLGGDDVICGGPGGDRLSGGGGDDQLFGDAGNDVLKGGPGRDRLFGQRGRDTLDGQSGSDRCDGGSGSDKATRCERTKRVP